MFYDKFEKICAARKTTPSTVCQEIGLNRSTSAYWKRSGGTPKRETLEKIAAILDVSVDYLLDRDEKNAPDDARSALIDKINLLSDEQAAHLLAILEGLVSG